MAIDVTIDHDAHQVTAVASGTVSAADVFAFVDEYRNGPSRTYALLFDARTAQPMARFHDVALMAEAMKRRTLTAAPRGAVAIVGGESTIEFARQYEALCREAGVDVIRAFDRIDDAKAWLQTQPRRTTT
jgi:hypothetical protein